MNSIKFKKISSPSFPFGILLTIENLDQLYALKEITYGSSSGLVDALRDYLIMEIKAVEIVGEDKCLMK